MNFNMNLEYKIIGVIMNTDKWTEIIVSKEISKDRISEYLYKNKEIEITDKLISNLLNC